MTDETFNENNMCYKGSIVSNKIVSISTCLSQSLDAILKDFTTKDDATDSGQSNSHK